MCQSGRVGIQEPSSHQQRRQNCDQHVQRKQSRLQRPVHRAIPPPGADRHPGERAGILPVGPLAPALRHVSYTRLCRHERKPGLTESARASPIRWRGPPENSCAYRFAASAARPTMTSNSRARAFASRRFALNGGAAGSRPKNNPGSAALGHEKGERLAAHRT
jgi:hypothetical protein